MKDETKLNNNRKPLTERKRRARINASLEALKNILETSDPETIGITCRRNVKLEKADILELTVKYLQKITVQKQQYLQLVQYHPHGYFRQPPGPHGYVYPNANGRTVGVPRRRVALLPPSPPHDGKLYGYCHASASEGNNGLKNDLVGLPPSPPHEEGEEDEGQGGRFSCWRPW